MLKKLFSTHLMLLLLLCGFSSCSELPEEIPLEGPKLDYKFGVLSYEMGESYEQTLFKDTEQGQIWVYKNAEDAIMVQVYCGAKDSTYSDDTFGSLSVFSPNVKLTIGVNGNQKMSQNDYFVNDYRVKEVYSVDNMGKNSLELCVNNIGSEHYYIMITGMDLTDESVTAMREALKLIKINL